MKPIGWVAVGGAGLLGYWYLRNRRRQVVVSERELITDSTGQEEIEVTAEVRRRRRRRRRQDRAGRQGGTVDVEQFDLIPPSESDTQEAYEPDIVAIDPEMAERLSVRDAWFAQYGITPEQFDRAYAALKAIQERSGMTRRQIIAQAQQCEKLYGHGCALQMAISAAKGEGYYA